MDAKKKVEILKKVNETTNQQVAVKLVDKIEKLISNKEKADEKQAKLLKRLVSVLIIACLASSCSFIDPSASGNIAGGQAHEMSMPEDGKLIVTHIYERKPNKDGANAGTVYNRRSFTDWFFGSSVKEATTDNSYVK